MIEWMNRRPDFAFVLFLVFSALVFYLPKLLLGENLVGQDMVTIGLPLFTLESQMLWNGELPLWDPYVLSGRPLFALTYISLIYPLNWGLLFSPTPLAVEFRAVLDFIILGLVTYWFARELGLSPLPSTIAAFVFAFSENTTLRMWGGHLNIIETSAALPLLFVAILRLSRNNSFPNILLGSIATALLLLPGFPQIAYYIFMAGALFGVFLVSTEVPPSRRLHVCSSGVMMVVGGLALIAVQLLPTFEMLRLSGRGAGVGYDFAVSGSLPPWYIITTIAPDFFGTLPGLGQDSLSQFGWSMHEMALYVGAVAILLAVYGSFAGVRQKRAAFFVMLALFFLVISFGKYTPLYSLFVRFAPGYETFRVPARHIIIVVFSLAMLAGWGTHYLFIGKRVPSVFTRLVFSMLVLVSGGLLLGLAFRAFLLQEASSQLTSGFLSRYVQIERVPYLADLYDNAIRSLWLPFLLLLLFSIWVVLFRNRLGENYSKATLVLLVVGGLFAFNMRVTSWRPPYYQPAGRQMPLLERELLHQEERFRVFLLEGELASSFAENTNAFGQENRIEIVNGYDPGILADYARYASLIYGTEEIRLALPNSSELIQPGLLDLFNVRFVIAGAALPVDLQYGWRLLGEEDGIWLYENTHAQPRAYLVGTSNAELVRDRNEAFDRLAKGIEPSTVLIEADSTPPTLAQPGNLAVHQDKVAITEYRNSYINIAAEVSTSSYLVLSDMYYPGWTAKVDGNSQDILRANAIFRAIPLEPGKHTVEFLFLPTYLPLGAAISGATVVLFLVLGIRAFRVRRIT